MKKSTLFAFAVIAFASTISFAGELIDRVVAVVGQDVIMLSELEEFTAVYQQVSREDGLEALIDDMLVEQEARRQGVEISDAEVEANIQTRIAQLNASETEFAAMLAQQGLTMEVYRERVRAKIMKYKFVQQQMRGGVDISEDEILNYYRTHPEEFTAESEIRIAHLFLPFPLSGEADQLDKIRKLGDELRARIDKGEDFAELVKKYSRGPAPEEGGDMGWVRIEDLNLHFVAALKEPTKGFITAAFETDNGVHILKVLDVKGAETVPFEQIRELVYQRLFELKIQDEMSRFVRDIKLRTPIERKL